MTRELRRLLIEPARLAAAAVGDAGAGGDAGAALVALRAEERHYLERVLRYRVGARLAVVDGAGGLWSALLAEGGWLGLEQPPSAPLERQPPPQPELLLALAVPKREVELVWRMATELGADRLQPLGAERCVPLGAAPLERWRSVVREASEQCERLWLPALESPAPAGAWWAEALADGAAVGLLATTRRGGLPSLGEALTGLPAVLPVALPAARPVAVPGVAQGLGRVCLAIGPEGGWSEEEEALAEGAGWVPVSLGETILRSATAAVAGMAALASWRSLSSSSSLRPSP
jgi:16S rRNA (uracil1498-N3)-methyltransferase